MPKGFAPPKPYRPVPVIYTKVPPLLSTADKQRMIHPFLPTQNNPNLIGASPPPTASAPRQSSLHSSSSRLQSDDLPLLPPLRFEDMRDAETNEPLQPTNAVWSAAEGRINMDRATILSRGTGKLDIPAADPSNKLPSMMADDTPDHVRAGSIAPSQVGSMRAGAKGRHASMRRGGDVYAEVVAAAAEAAAVAAAAPPPLSITTSPHLHDLVARFMREGPLQLIHHKFYDPHTNTLHLPRDYENDADGDLAPYLSPVGQTDLRGTHADDASVGMSSVGGFRSGNSSSLSSAALTASTASKGGSLKRETPEQRKARWKAEKTARFDKSKADVLKKIDAARPRSAETAAAEAAKNAAEDARQKEEDAREPIISDASTIASQLGDKWDLHDATLWHALEKRYYDEIAKFALEYEKNKLWTKEKRMPKGVRGMEEACKAYAGWRARSLKNLIHFIDEEQRRDAQRIEVEDQTTNEVKLKEIIKKHDAERHQHRLFVRVSEYEMEILTIRKLNEMGLLW